MSAENFEFPENLSPDKSNIIPSAPYGVDIPGDERIGEIHLPRGDHAVLERFGSEIGFDGEKMDKVLQEVGADVNAGNNTLPSFLKWDDDRTRLDFIVAERVKSGQPLDEPVWTRMMLHLRDACVKSFGAVVADMIAERSGDMSEDEMIAEGVASLMYDDSQQRMKAYRSSILDSYEDRDLVMIDDEEIDEFALQLLRNADDEVCVETMMDTYTDYLKDAFMTLAERYAEDRRFAQEQYMIEATAANAEKMQELETKIDELRRLLGSVADKLGVVDVDESESDEPNDDEVTE